MPCRSRVLLPPTRHTQGLPLRIHAGNFSIALTSFLPGQPPVLHLNREKCFKQGQMMSCYAILENEELPWRWSPPRHCCALAKPQNKLMAPGLASARDQEPSAVSRTAFSRRERNMQCTGRF